MGDEAYHQNLVLIRSLREYNGSSPYYWNFDLALVLLITTAKETELHPHDPGTKIIIFKECTKLYIYFLHKIMLGKITLCACTAFYMFRFFRLMAAIAHIALLSPVCTVEQFKNNYRKINYLKPSGDDIMHKRRDEV